MSNDTVSVAAEELSSGDMIDLHPAYYRFARTDPDRIGFQYEYATVTGIEYADAGTVIEHESGAFVVPTGYKVPRVITDAAGSRPGL